MTISRLLGVAALTLALSVPQLSARGHSATCCPEAPDTVQARRVVLFERDTAFYRIPALARLRDGTLVLAADRRNDSNNDLPGRIDVLSRRSTDGGATWEPAVVVNQNTGKMGGFGDPALVQDSVSGDLLCISTHGEGLWTAKPGHSARIVVNRSHDGGASWSAPVDITDQLLGLPGSGAPIEAVTAFASSGRALCTPQGRLMFVLVTKPSADEGRLEVVAVHSDDSGRTWHAAASGSPTPTGDEAKVAALPDGSLLMSIRHRGARLVSRSMDGGDNWTPAVTVEDLVEPACNGDLFLLQDGRLAHTLCHDPSERRNVSLLISQDGGLTWPVAQTIYEPSSAYSSAVQLDANTIGVVTEEANADDYASGFRLVYTQQPLPPAVE